MINEKLFGMYISTIYKLTQSHIAKELAEFNIGSGQFQYIVILENFDGINQEKIAEMCKVDKATAAKAISKLVQSGYIKRNHSKEDKRSFILHLTSKGKEIVPIIMNILRNWQNTLFKNFKQSEILTLVSLLEKSFNNICESKKTER